MNLNEEVGIVGHPPSAWENSHVGFRNFHTSPQKKMSLIDQIDQTSPPPFCKTSWMFRWKAKVSEMLQSETYRWALCPACPRANQVLLHQLHRGAAVSLSFPPAMQHTALRVRSLNYTFMCTPCKYFPFLRVSVWLDVDPKRFYSCSCHLDERSLAWKKRRVQTSIGKQNQFLPTYSWLVDFIGWVACNNAEL